MEILSVGEVREPFKLLLGSEEFDRQRKILLIKIIEIRARH